MIVDIKNDMNDNDDNIYNNVIIMLKSLCLNNKIVWSNIIDIILIAQNTITKSHINNNKSSFVSELESVIIELMKQENLCMILFDILNDTSDIHMIKRAQQFLNGYKVLINYIGFSIDTFANGILLADNWINTIISSMLSIVNNDTNEIVIKSFCSLVAYDILPRNAEIAILRNLIVIENDKTDFIISKVSDDWSFQSIELILRDTIDTYTRQRFDITSNHFDNLMKQLINRV
jgi:hypothetical protein